MLIQHALQYLLLWTQWLRWKPGILDSQFFTLHLFVILIFTFILWFVGRLVRHD